MGRRIRWLALVMILCFTLVLLQLANIQFKKASALVNSPLNPRNAELKYQNQRGDILAADGTVLAQSVPATQGPWKYTRVYPEDATHPASLYSSVVGYDSIYLGTSGVEYQYNSYLSAHSQSAQSLSQLLSPPPKTTDNVTLTIEPKLQQAAAQAIAAIPGANQDAAVVGINPKTGAVEFMYSNPSYDPNQLSQADVTKEQAAATQLHQADREGFSSLVPLATQEIFFPGSTAKVMTSAAVYNLDPSLVNFNYPADQQDSCLKLPNSNQILCNDGTTIDNSAICGGMMVTMLPESCDPGYGALGLQLQGKLTQQAQMFGYNAVPPIDLPNVVASKFPAESAISGQNQAFAAYSAIGQFDVQATALQNAMVAATIANGGLEMVPHVMSQIRQSDGTVVKSYAPAVYQRAVSPQTAAQVTTLMQGVAQPGGTAAGVGFSPSLNVAVKTGTAQTSSTASPATSNVDWMIGFAPANNPQIAIAVVVPEQNKASDGAGVAGPIMLSMLTAALQGT